MRRDEEEILIRDDSGLLYDESVTVSVRPRPANWCHKFNKILCFSLAFFVMGLCIAVPGPTLLDLADKLGTDIPHISTIFSARAVGYLVGAILGGALFSYFDKQLLMFCTLLMCSVATVVVPWCFTLVAMATLVALQGLGLGILYTGGNIFCVKLWGRKSAPYLQILHFAFALGAFLAPILAMPFLSNENLFTNTTALSSEASDSINSSRNIRSAFDEEGQKHIHVGLGGINGVLLEKEERFKRQDSPFDTDQDTTTKTSKTTVIKPLNTAVHALPSDIKATSDISRDKNVNKTTQNQNLNEQNAQTIPKVTETVAVTAKIPTTPKVTKPKVNVDGPLKSHTADSKQMSNLKPASEDDIKKMPNPDVHVPPDKNTNETSSKESEKTSQIVTKAPSGSLTVLPASKDKTGNQSSQTGDQTMKSSTTPGLADESRELKNETVTQSTTRTTEPEKSLPNSPAVGPHASIKHAQTTAAKPKPTSPTTTTTTTTTTTPKPRTTTPRPITSTEAPTTTTTTKASSASRTEAPVTQPPEITKTKTEHPEVTKPKPALSTTGKVVTENPQPKKTSIAGSDKSVTVSSTAVMSTKAPKKPTTAGDIFNNVIGLVKTISKVQFVYAIIGTVAFVSSLVFLICYCRNKKRLTLTVGENYYEGVKGNGGCFKATVLFMLFLFFICYVGLEVAFGGLVTTFTVRFNHWPKEKGAVVNAIFWGAVAVGRGFSVFITRCCRPTAMLSVDLSLVVFGGLVLSVGTYFYDKLLWLGTLILGLGMSSVLPGIISWTETYFSSSGKSAAVFVLGSVLGEMFLPILTTYLFTVQDEMVLMRIALALGAVMLVLFIVMSCYASRKGETYSLRDRNGFLPLQAEDNEDENVEMDLMDLDTPLKRRQQRKKMGDSESAMLISDLEED